MKRLTFCESGGGTGLFWHLRELADGEEPKLGGGVHGSACGQEWPNGWDCQAEVTTESIDRDYVCRRCVAAVQQEEDGG